MNFNINNMIGKIIEEIQKPLKIVSIVGSGLSKGSGMPTFRGTDGLWRNYNSQDLATLDAFKRDPYLVWNWYKWRMRALLPANPNAAHQVLVDLEKRGVSLGIITQNVDGLNEIAGNDPSHIVEIHGRIRYARCMSCHYMTRWDVEENTIEDGPIPKCPNCTNTFLRPDVVWFGEQLDQNDLYKATGWIDQCNLMLVIGTSGTVYPVASFPQIAKNQGKIVLEFNIEPTPLTPICDHSFFGPCEESLPKFMQSISHLLS